MKNSKIVVIVSSVWLTVSLFANDSGELNVFILSDGKPLSNNEIVIDKTKKILTDKDGMAKLVLEPGEHQVELFGANTSGHLGYFKKNIEIKSGKETQVISTFNTNVEPYVIVDSPKNNTIVTPKKLDMSILGTLKVRVISQDKKTPIKNGRIFVKGTALDARSDDNGYAILQVPANQKITISVIHSEYSSETLSDLLVKQGETLAKEIVLAPASLELEEFVVLAPKVEGAIASIVQEEKESQSIVNILGSEEIAKKGDSDAAGALKRVTGVTLIGGKNIYIRGLGDRYSNIEMNSMPLPSPNPLKRAVPLDIFPSSAIGSMVIQKSATADIPASFGGGYVDIRTKESSKDNFFKVSLETKGNSNTGKSIDTYQGSDMDWTGFDDGYRAVSSNILANSKVVVGEKLKSFTTNNFSKSELSSFTQQHVNRDYEVTSENLPVGFKGSVEGGYNFTIGDDHRLSLFGNYSYEQDNRFVEETYSRYDMDGSTGQLEETANQYGTIRNTFNAINQSAMMNIGYNYLDVLKLQFTKLYTHNALKSTRIADGIMGSNDEDMTRYYLDWEERTLDVNQLNGSLAYQIFNMDSNLRFGLEYALADLYQPNNYSYTYLNEGEPHLFNQVTNNIANNLESSDTLFAGYLANKLMINWLSDEDFIDFGISMSSKERQSKQNKYYLRKINGSAIVPDTSFVGGIESIYDTYVRKDIAYDNRSLLVSQVFRAADYYDAQVDELDLYVSSLVKPTDSLEFIFGLRNVSLNQTVYQYKEDRTNPDMSQRLKIQKYAEELTLNDIFPSFGAKYILNDSNHFDVAFSKTYIVPDLREFTEGEYFHPYEVATIVGNPNLENTMIYNADFKYSHFFSAVDAIKLGLFYKYLDKPIEDVMIPSSSLPIYGFDNADSAVLYGFEIDGHKGLDFISSYLDGFYVSGNFSYTQSDVTLREEQEAIYSTNHRDLQGLSPTVFNATLGYDSKWRSTSISYNKMGERIRKVGMIDTGNLYPDHTEIPPQLVDFIWIEKFTNGLSFQAKVQNILNEETIWKQGDRISNSYKTGTNVSLGLAYKY
jgi:TonB-dependent receptor